MTEVDAFAASVSLGSNSNTIEVDQFTAGINTISLQRSDLIQSGVYIYEIKFGDKVLHGKMIMID